MLPATPLFAPQIRNELEKQMSCNLKEFKEFIDNEMLLILGQMDKPSLIFDHLYLVSSRGSGPASGRAWPFDTFQALLASLS